MPPSCIRRSGRKGAFRYHTDAGRPVRDRGEIARLNAVGIPPAYRDICLAPSARARVQGTGVDNRGRTQYRYHKLHVARSSAAKFARLADFGRALPGIRGRARGLLRSADERARATGFALTLLDKCHFRPGSQRYLKANRTVGVTTLDARKHVKLKAGGRVDIHFKGKAGVMNSCSIRDPLLRDVVRRGARSGTLTARGRPLDLAAELPSGLLVKDFRTWGANARFIAAAEARRGSRAPPKKVLKAVLGDVARALSHTPSVCRKNYILPSLVQRVLEGRRMPRPAPGFRGLSGSEKQLMSALRG